MSELHQERDQAPDEQPDEQPAETPTPAADVAWPELPSQQLPAELSGPAAPEHAAAVLDPAVNAVLDRLAAVRQMPVSGHGEVYAGLHDALLEALNEEVAGHAGVARRIHAAGNGGS
jgi:hypothetical protein